ncbi:MAG: formyltransferase family protein [Pirellulaceae bacterium]
MRILVITEEDEFYLPECLDRFLEQITSDHDVAGVVLAENTLLPGPWAAARKFYRVFGLWPVAQQAFRLARARFLDRVYSLRAQGRTYSMPAVCRKWGIDCSCVKDVNSEEFIKRIAKEEIDLIVSISPTQKFKKRLLQTPRQGCINIHSSPLPKYRGLYPTYWAMACGEAKTAVSVHYMSEELDQGGIVIQQEIEIPPNCSMDYMLTKAKRVGADLLALAVKQISNDTVKPVLPGGEGSYYSFPTKQSYRDFRRLGYRLW